ncbi:hypothetical protein WAK64_17930 [Bacillus spongiae]|uniref:IDEAL domain-containing protein n=1 Tax=Bacillus spongiae TaxID=2683610 RepID=A0ABU8HHR9_9BACI
MLNRYVLLLPYLHKIDCFRSMDPIPLTLQLKMGDEVRICDERKFVENAGWYVLIEINEVHSYFINIEDLESMYLQGFMCSFDDLELKINYVQYKINESLEKNDKVDFFTYSDQLKKLQQILPKAYNV